ncbi:MAG: hypothetical protein ACXVCS_05825 [Bdellovibrionota bacterium]
MKALIPLLLATLASTPALAGGSTGGGNTVNHQLVEDYAVTDSAAEIPDFSQLDRYLHVISDRIPGCGNELHQIAYPDPNNVDGVVWYLIPAKISQLPSSVSGLDFSSDQPAKQSDKEIFLSATEIEGLSPQSRGELYLHEVLMMNQADKDGEAVRKLMIYLKRTNYSPSDQSLKNVMGQLKFSCGRYQTVSEIAAEAAERKRQAEVMAKQTEMATQSAAVAEVAALSNYLNDSGVACAASADAKTKLASLQKTFKLMDFYFNVSKADVAQIPTLNANDDSDRGTVQAEAEWMDKELRNGHFASLMGSLDFVLGADTPNYGLWVNDKQTPDASVTINASATRDLLVKFALKYANYTDAQRVDQACSDVAALMQSTLGGTPVHSTGNSDNTFIAR